MGNFYTPHWHSKTVIKTNNFFESKGIYFLRDIILKVFENYIWCFIQSLHIFFCVWSYGEHLLPMEPHGEED